MRKTPTTLELTRLASRLVADICPHDPDHFLVNDLVPPSVDVIRMLSRDSLKRRDAVVHLGLYVSVLAEAMGRMYADDEMYAEIIDSEDFADFADIYAEKFWEFGLVMLGILVEDGLVSAA